MRCPHAPRDDQALEGRVNKDENNVRGTTKKNPQKTKFLATTTTTDDDDEQVDHIY